MRKQSLGSWLILGILLIMGPLKADDEHCSIFPKCDDNPPPCTTKLGDRKAAGCYAACGSYLEGCKASCDSSSHQYIGSYTACRNDYMSCVENCFAPKKQEYVVYESHKGHKKRHGKYVEAIPLVYSHSTLKAN